MTQAPAQSILGTSQLRVDGRPKVTGEALYADDLSLPGMLWAGCVHSTQPRAEARVDASAALAIPGVACVLTEEDFPRPQSTYDWFYCTSRPLYIGDVVAVVAARSPEQLAAALKAVKVTYKRLPGVFTIEEALAEGAPQLREKGVALGEDGTPDASRPGNVFLDSWKPLRKGDVAAGFAASDVVLERTYETQYIEHGYIEPESVLVSADPDMEGGVLVRSCSQQGHEPRGFVAHALGLPQARVRAVQCAVGGSFGGKFELVGLMCARAAMVWAATGHPCKLTYAREDSLVESPKRHPFRTTVRIGATREGKILAYEASQIENAGAYNNQSPWMNIRARVHSAGPYAIPNVRTDTFSVFTDNPVPGAMRGYSSPQVIFGNESAIDELADELGVDALDVKLQNLLRRGDETATSQTLVHQTLLRRITADIVEATGYRAKRAAWKSDAGEWRRGIGLVTSYRGVALGGEGVDSSGTMMTLLPDGGLIVRAALMEIGQGLRTVYAQVASEASGVPMENVVVEPVDTSAIPDAGLTVASRGTAQGAQSVRLAGERIRAMLEETARGVLGARPGERVEIGAVCRVCGDPSRSASLQDVCTARKWSGESMAAFEWYVPRPLVNDDRTGQGEAFTTYAYGACVAEVSVSSLTGRVRVDRVTSYHDVGHALNPALVRGQIYGGILMGMGFGLWEDVRMREGKTADVNLDAYHLSTACDLPEIRVRLYECADPEGTYGAKCIAEAATEMVGTALALAVGHAAHAHARKLPLTPERVLALFGEGRCAPCARLR